MQGHSTPYLTNTVQNTISKFKDKARFRGKILALNAFIRKKRKKLSICFKYLEKIVQ